MKHDAPVRPLHTLLPALTLVCLLAGALPAGEKTATGPDPAVLRLAVRAPQERAGSADALADAWLDALAAHPLDLSSELLARRLGSLRPTLRDEAALVPRLEEILAASPGVQGLTRQVLIEVLADLYRLQGHHEKSRSLREKQGFLTHWLVIGPFGKGQASLMERAFPPERELKLDTTYRDGWQDLEWRRVDRREPDPLFQPLRYVYPTTGIAYALAQVQSDEEREAVLHRGAGQGLRIWLNGELVVDDDYQESFLENRRRTGIRLARGWNRFLVKSRAPFWIRISDGDDNPFPPGSLVEEEGLVLHEVEPLPEPSREGPYLPDITTRWTEWLSTLSPAGEKSGTEADSEAVGLRVDGLLGLAMLYDLYGREDLAVETVEHALEIRPEDPVALYHSGGILRGARYLPDNLSKNRAKQAFESVLRIDPDFVPTYERVARFLAEDQQHPEAIQKVQDGLAKNPAYLRGLLRLKAIYAEQDWQSEEIAVVREIEKLSPSSSVPPAFWAQHYRSLGNAREAAAHLRTAYERDGRQTRLLDDMASLALAAGDAETCEKLLREAVQLEPDDISHLDRLCEFLADRGRLDEAVSLARDAAARYPMHPQRLERVAQILDRAGKADEALAAYEEALRLMPGDIHLARYLAERKVQPTAQLTPAGDDAFWTPYDESLEDWLGHVPLEGPFVARAAALLVLDIAVVRVEPDGSYSEYTHQAHKLLSEESKEELANVNVGEEIITLRTLTADGETLEPVAAQGKSSYVMPGLAAGAFIEVAYRNDREGAGGRPFRGSHFYFQDMRFQSPFLLTRYVVILPEGMEPGFLEMGIPADGDAAARPEGVPFAEVKKTVRELDDGGTVVVYEARNVPRIEPEPLMPAGEEYIPNVQVLEEVTWEDVAAWLRQRYAGATRLTPELEAAAVEATRDIEEPLAKVRAVYDYVNELVTNDSGSSSAVQVLLEKAGNRNILFKALLSALDLPVSWVYLRPAEAYLARTDWSIPRLDLFPYPHLMVELEGRQPLFITLSQRLTPFARLPEQFSGGKALVVDSDEQRILTLPTDDPEESATVTTISLELTDDTAVDVDMELVSKAVMAYAQKDRLKTLSAFQKDLALRAMANQLFPGSSLKSGDLRDLEDPDKPFAVVLDLTAPEFLRERGDDYLLRVVLQPAMMVRRFCTVPRRKHPLHFRNQMVLRDTVTVRPGDAFEIEATPSDVLLVSSLGTYTLSFHREGDLLRASRELSLFPGRIEPSEFPAFVEFSRKIDAAEQESVICRKKPAPGSAERGAGETDGDG